MSPAAAEPTLFIPAAAAAEAEQANKLYEASVPSILQRWKRYGNALYTFAGIFSLIYLAWSEPFSARLLAKLPSGPAYVLQQLVMIARGVLFVEAFGYMYHRFFQHLGWLTRRAPVFRRNQRFHWMHHMILYPIGRFYKREGAYVSSEGGLGASWLVPAVVAIAYAFWSMGLHVSTFVFVGSMVAYALLLVDDIHARFHLMTHSYIGNRYYKWLEDIHILHHWDQRNNFTIVHPLMDVIFGTYLAPAAHQRELEVCYSDKELTVSDIVNWRYLLLEATPVEYASFISEAKRHPRSQRKLGLLVDILGHRVARHPQDAVAGEMRRRALDLSAAIAA
jgi:hypothetical protein